MHGFPIDVKPVHGSFEHLTEMRKVMVAISLRCYIGRASLIRGF